MPTLNFQDLEIRKGLLISKEDHQPFGCIVAMPNSLFIDHFTGNTCISSEHIIATNKGSDDDYLRKGDIVLQSSGNIGKFYPIKKSFPIPVVVSQYLTIIKKNKKNNLIELFEDEDFIKAFKAKLSEITEGASVKRINLQKLKTVTINW